MRTVRMDKILESLSLFQLRYELVGNPANTYTTASVFAPLSNGFYFFTGDHLPEMISDSLVVVNRIPESFSKSNCYIIVQDNPQRVFYRILDNLFSRQSNGRISTTSIIHPNARLGKNIQIDDFCVIGNCIIGDNVIIGSHCNIHDLTEIGSGTIIESHAAVGTSGVAWIWGEGELERIVQPQLGGVKVGRNCFLGSNTIVVRGSLSEFTVIEDFTLMAPGCRIGHGTWVESFVHFANSVVTGGNTRIGSASFVGSAAVFRPKVAIHPNTIVGAGAVVVKNTTCSGLTLTGVPAEEKATKANPSGMPQPKIPSS